MMASVYIWKFFHRPFNWIPISVSYLNLRGISALLERGIVRKHGGGRWHRNLVSLGWIDLIARFAPLCVMSGGDLLGSTRGLNLLDDFKHMLHVFIGIIFGNRLTSKLMSYVYRIFDQYKALFSVVISIYHIFSLTVEIAFFNLQCCSQGPHSSVMLRNRAIWTC